MNYDPEANILSWELGKGKIKQTKEFGNFLLHLGANNKPILIEVLDASRFKSQSLKIPDKGEVKKAISTN